jgi:hypothetical protein
LSLLSFSLLSNNKGDIKPSKSNKNKNKNGPRKDVDVAIVDYDDAIGCA